MPRTRPAVRKLLKIQDSNSLWVRRRVRRTAQEVPLVNDARPREVRHRFVQTHHADKHQENTTELFPSLNLQQQPDMLLSFLRRYGPKQPAFNTRCSSRKGCRSCSNIRSKSFNILHQPSPQSRLACLTQRPPLPTLQAPTENSNEFADQSC